MCRRDRSVKLVTFCYKPCGVTNQWYAATCLLATALSRAVQGSLFASRRYVLHIWPLLSQVMQGAALCTKPPRHLLCFVPCSCCHHCCCGCSNAAHALHEIEADALSHQYGASTAADAAKLLPFLNAVPICLQHTSSSAARDKATTCPCWRESAWQCQAVNATTHDISDTQNQARTDPSCCSGPGWLSHISHTRTAALCPQL